MQPRWIVPTKFSKNAASKRFFARELNKSHPHSHPEIQHGWTQDYLYNTVGVSEIRKTQSNKWRLVTIFVTGFHISDISKNWLLRRIRIRR